MGPEPSEEHIALLGKCLTGPERQSYEVIRSLEGGRFRAEVPHALEVRKKLEKTCIYIYSNRWMDGSIDRWIDK